MNMRGVPQTGWATLFLLSLQLCRAAEGDMANESADASLFEDHFQRGRYEAAITGGALYSFSGPAVRRSTIDYSYSSLQLGYMLGDIEGDGWCRGNFELAGEAFGSAIFHGDGSYISGGTLWLRYNFVPRTRRGWFPSSRPVRVSFPPT